MQVLEEMNLGNLGKGMMEIKFTHYRAVALCLRTYVQLSYCLLYHLHFYLLLLSVVSIKIRNGATICEMKSNGEHNEA